MASVISKRYANAVFELALSDNRVDSLEEEINLIKESITTREFLEYLSYPNVSEEDKISSVKQICGDYISDDLFGLIAIVIKKRRYNYLREIFDEVLELVDDYKGRKDVVIKSAYELTDEEKNKVVDRLTQITKKEIIPIFKIDESLIGGLVIKVGDKVVDSSVKGGLRLLSKSLLSDKAV